MMTKGLLSVVGLSLLLLQQAEAMPLSVSANPGHDLPGRGGYLVLAQAAGQINRPQFRAPTPRITPPRVTVPVKPLIPNIGERLTTKKPRDKQPKTATRQPDPVQTNDPAPVRTKTTAPVPPPRRPSVQALTGPIPLPSFRPFIAADLPDFRPNEVVARFGPGTAPTVPADVAATLDLQILRETTLALIDTRIVVFSIPADGRSVADVITQIAADGRGAQPQPNYYFILSQGSGSMVSSQYSLAALNVDAVQQETRGKGVRVAIIDSGIDTAHMELEGAIAADFDAAGYGIPDPDKHGTSIAGIVAARGQLRGVAPEASLIAVRAFWQNKKNEPLSSSSEVIARAIDWAVSEADAQVLNLSFAGPQDNLLAEVVQAATARGVIAVSAVGNAGPEAPPAYPAALPEVIAVTATDSKDGLFVAANRGDYVDVAAPGVDILSPAPGNGYQVITGTSMATANISGLLALMIEQNDAPIPPQSAEELLAETAIDLGPKGRDPEFGAGRADAVRVLGKLAPLRASIQ